MNSAVTGEIPDVNLPTEDFQRPTNETPKVSIPNWSLSANQYRRFLRPSQSHTELLQLLTYCFHLIRKVCPVNLIQKAEDG